MPTLTVKLLFTMLSLKSTPVIVNVGRTAPFEIVEGVAEITLDAVITRLKLLLEAAGATVKAEVAA